jgi:polyferredoxin
MHINFYLPLRAPGEGLVGFCRRALRRLGPTWEAAPLRRIAQVLALAIFFVLFFYVTWPYGSKDYAALRESKEVIDADAFLALDPLVSLSAAVAARVWVGSLVWAGALLAASLLVPRMFCGYVCPLGTIIDLVDWLVKGSGALSLRLLTPWALGAARGKGVRSLTDKAPNPLWRHVRYGVLVAALAAAALGVLISGYVAAIPVLVRGLAFVAGPLELAAAKGWYLVPPAALAAGQVVAIVLFLALVALAFLGPRFWCRHLCPSGAVFSVAGVLRLTERKVDARCIRCGRCVEACPFGAIKPDFSTRPLDCTFCQTCGGVCPVEAIQFTGRWTDVGSEAKGSGALSVRPLTPSSSRASTGEGVRSLNSVGLLTPSAGISRRAFLGGAAGSVAAGLAAGVAVRTDLGGPLPSGAPVVRPPGSVPEREFLRLCVRCGACYQACPNSVLQPMCLAVGLDGLWTPEARPDWSGCEPTCNNCGHVCPTGAIRSLPLAEKRAARMGLAVVNQATCLPFAGREACRMCYDECRAAGYDAIEFVRVGVQTDADGAPIEDSGYLAPVVLADKCNGCGLCQTRCYKINAHTKHLLAKTAIRVEAGPGKEDRLMAGSYLALREAEREKRKTQGQGGGTYLPDFLK